MSDGASADADRALVNGTHSGFRPSGFDPSRGLHPAYGPCDAFGPLWTCSACTGVIGRRDGSFVAAATGLEIASDDAAAMVGDWLLSRAEMAAVAAWGCCTKPAQIADFVRAELVFDMPGNPWRLPYASGIVTEGGNGAAGSGERSELEPDPKGDAQTPSPAQ